jgi:hypothetical protein
MGKVFGYHAQDGSFTTTPMHPSQLDDVGGDKSQVLLEALKRRLASAQEKITAEQEERVKLDETIDKLKSTIDKFLELCQAHLSEKIRLREEFERSDPERLRNLECVEQLPTIIAQLEGRIKAPETTTTTKKRVRFEDEIRGGKPCQQEGGCPNAAIPRYDHCAEHGGGYKRCLEGDCLTEARSGFNHCTKHGGGKRCQAEGCLTAVVNGFDLCHKHGGKRYCQVEGCSNIVQSNKRCQTHLVKKTKTITVQECVAGK